ncbi:MAG: TetR/AcrR family transcriptional regulator [Chloroflexi bacterium]|nr:TetR/AcrR family transcriptional regulator [Chloroflexota bacterium]
MPRVSTEHEEAVRTRIVEAALRAFTERGFHQATMQDVARESGLSVGAIYGYFSGKDELLRAVCDLALSQELDVYAQQIATAPTVRQKMDLGVQAWVTGMTRDPGPGFIAQMWGEAIQTPAVREVLARRRERLTAVVMMLLREGIARGELASVVDVEALGAALSGMLDGLALQAIEEGPSFRPIVAERRAMAILDVLFPAPCPPDYSVRASSR